MVAMQRTGEVVPHTCELLLTILWVEDVRKPVRAMLHLRTAMVANRGASQHVARSPVRNRNVRAAQVRKLRHPEGTTLGRLPIELHAQSWSRGRQQVTILPLGLHRDDIGQECSWPVGLLLDTEVRARGVQVQAGGRRDRPERVVDGELYVVRLAHRRDLLRL